tara:strand:+ start:2845 stop:3849 length:1005 start_codon:yes stop_codon:yes gene_type:complete
MINFYILIAFLFLNLSFLIFFDNIKILHKIIDKPDKKRKFHKNPTPLAGGIILFFNIILYAILCFINNDLLTEEIIFKNFLEFKLFIISCISFFIIGILDDKYNIKPSIKFLFLIIVLFILLYFDSNLKIIEINFSFLDISINSINYSIIFTLFCILVFINSFNMFDGINLQASTYSLILITILIIYLKFSLFLSILLIFILCFKYLNFKNKTFLGDNGTLLISFIFSFIFIKLYNENIIIHSDEIFIYMLVPGIDMIRLFFTRILMNRSPFSDDRIHIHHLLLDKFTYLQSLIIINSLILMPILLIKVNINNLFSILLTITLYTVIIIKIRKV